MNKSNALTTLKNFKSLSRKRKAAVKKWVAKAAKLESELSLIYSYGGPFTNNRHEEIPKELKLVSEAIKDLLVEA